jgi:hypothetical protein
VFTCKCLPVSVYILLQKRKSALPTLDEIRWLVKYCETNILLHVKKIQRSVKGRYNQNINWLQSVRKLLDSPPIHRFLGISHLVKTEGSGVCSNLKNESKLTVFPPSPSNSPSRREVSALVHVFLTSLYGNMVCILWSPLL